MGSRQQIDITDDLKSLHQDATAAVYILNRIIIKAHKAEGYDNPPKDYYCKSKEEAKSFFISIATESPLTAEQTDIVLASWALFDGYQDYENITTRRERYLAEREEYDPSYIKGIPFKELENKKNRIDGLNRLSIYPIINRYFNSQPNLIEYISVACKRHIKDIGGENAVALPIPSYKLNRKKYTDTEKVKKLEGSSAENADIGEEISVFPVEVSTMTSVDDDPGKPRIRHLGIAIVGAVIIAGIILLTLIVKNNTDQIKRTPRISGGDPIDIYLKLSNDIEKLQDDTEYRAELLAEAEQGNAEYQFHLGNSYVLSKEYTSAEQWFLSAAEQDYAPAQSILCLLYDQMGGKEAEIYNWASKAADNHDALGYFYLGRCYDRGFVVETDYAKAATLYQCVIDMKGTDGKKLTEPFAEYDEIIAKCFAESALAVLYQNGNGVDQSFTDALRLFKAAYDDGYNNAALHISEFYYFGYGVEEDHETARLWYLKASEKN